MAPPFMPFAAPPVAPPEPPSFEPRPGPRPTPTAPSPSRGTPATKEWADLVEALQLGLGPEEMEQVTRGLPLGTREPSCARPLVLRDFGRPAPPRPDAGRIPTIVVTRADDVVRRVTIECTCGETLSLDCVY